MTDYHVMYSDEDREWKVKKEGNLKATTTAPTKKDAEKKAKKYAKKNKPSSVYIHYQAAGQDLGPIQNVISYT